MKAYSLYIRACRSHLAFYACFPNVARRTSATFPGVQPPSSTHARARRRRRRWRLEPRLQRARFIFDASSRAFARHVVREEIAINAEAKSSGNAATHDSSHNMEEDDGDEAAKDQVEQFEKEAAIEQQILRTRAGANGAQSRNAKGKNGAKNGQPPGKKTSPSGASNRGNGKAAQGSGSRAKNKRGGGRGGPTHAALNKDQLSNTGCASNANYRGAQFFSVIENQRGCQFALTSSSHEPCARFEHLRAAQMRN